MPVYMISVICAAAISGIILSLIFHRLKLFNFRTAAAITLASLVTALVMPGVLSLIYSSGNSGQDPSMHAILAIVSILIYIVLVLILSAAIAFLLPKIKTRQKAEALAGTGAGTADAAASVPQDMGQAEIAETVPSPVQESDAAAAETAASSEESETQSAPTLEPDTAFAPDMAFAQLLDPETQASPAFAQDTPIAPEDGADPLDENNMDGDWDMRAGDNYIEEIYLKFVGRNDEDSSATANNEINEGFEENSDEKSVDSTENIDKMGIENNIQDSGSMTIEECIDEAFRLREAGDTEGSILYFMYALDRKPPKELTFWIILDICVMYKSLGQQDLALDILNGYYDIYGDEMYSSVKEEIVRNLTDIEV